MRFSAKKKKWLIQNNKRLHGVLVGDAINHAQAADIYYRKALDAELSRFIDSLYKDLKRHYNIIRIQNAYTGAQKSPASVRKVLNLYKGAKFKIFMRNAEKIVNKWIKKASGLTEKSVRDMLYKMAGQQFSINYDAAYNEALKLMVRRNVQLITNATTQTLTNVENIVYDAMTTGQGWYDVSNTLKTQQEVSSKRIKLIARDQTAKTNQALNELTQRDAGIEYFMWRTAQDERVSTGKGGHKQLNNKIYKWGDFENYPEIDSYGNRGVPSQRPNCRCTALAVILLKGWRLKQLPDGSYEVVKDKNSDY